MTKFSASVDIDKNTKKSFENIHLVVTMLDHSKTEVTQKALEGFNSDENRKSFDERIKVILEEDGADINLKDVDITCLVKLADCKNYKEALNKFSNEELEAIAQLARDELQRRKLEQKETSKIAEDGQK